MALTKKFADEFSHNAQIEGYKLDELGHVRIDDRLPDSIEATVQGAQPYAVFLSRQKGAVRYSCECPYYASTAMPCKHVWATLVAAERAGYLEQWNTDRRLDLIPGDDEIFMDDLDLPTEHGGDMALRQSNKSRSTHPGQTQRPKAAQWKQSIASLRKAMLHADPHHVQSGWPVDREVLYVVDVHRTLEGHGLTVEVDSRERKKDGAWGRARKQAIQPADIASIPDARDREILSLVMGAQSAPDSSHSYYSYPYRTSTSSFRLGAAAQAPMTRRMCETGRTFIRPALEAELQLLQWDDAGTWQLWVVARQTSDGANFALIGELRRGEQRMDLTEPLLLVAGGLVFVHGTVAPLDDGDAFPWVALLRGQGELVIPAADRDELLQQMLSLPAMPRLDLPETLQVEEVKVIPHVRLRIRKPAKKSYYYGYANERLRGELSFDYEGHIVSHDEPGRGIYQPDRKRLILRDYDYERQAAAKMRAAGFKRQQQYGEDQPSFELTPSNLPSVIRKLTAESWLVEADGQLYRQPGEIKIDVTSGIDWFELHGAADFGGQSVKLPELLAALRRGEKTVRLGDGTFGVLPEQWLQKYGLLADMGTANEDHIRFGKTQVGVLDALLASQPEATCDAVFEQARDRMRNFDGVRAADAPETFVGSLRPYQREGLGWMEFLRDFSFGGCLADDMGLGKTVQVLALLESRRLLRTQPNVQTPSENGNGQHASANKKIGPSLVVVPRSLIFNWQEEAKKFSPGVRVLDHTGIARAKNADTFDQFDLILTTYGTLRNDITFLKDVPFDYLVLDEAQAIKNSASESAKAVRLLQGQHRLALSGTPVQNHLGELWSLFEFLNPGMLGTARAFQSATGSARIVEEQTRQLLSRALRPFILRRTKAQVAKDLPLRTEQTIHCELDAEQRKLYDELKEHYRQTLLTRIATEGIKKAKIQILEALLRLRQAACHPGLIDKKKTGSGSAKLDSLLAQLSEVMEENHKVLVFSQFTSFLAIVRDRLDKEKIPYEYLDGRTRDRKTPVERFQTDPNCKLFLISLKAGGLGLNLTAAEYVFLLDPWWNPAVEAQAIDRAHRIGQTRQVFAYRLIAQGTVEEKVLQLQQTKRDLADAIINADNSLIGSLGREDLELLLS
jgi:hypothetical protein